jgi:hypothetical protein
MGALTTWKPQLEMRIAELQITVSELQRSGLVHKPHVSINISTVSAIARFEFRFWFFYQI